MIGMIFGWTMREGRGTLCVRNHSDHLISELIVPDDVLLLKLLRGEVVKYIEEVR